jgi:hypothetical protein
MRRMSTGSHAGEKDLRIMSAQCYSAFAAMTPLGVWTPPA